MIADNSLAAFDSYVDGVMGGDVVVGEMVRAAVKRHLEDLKRESSPDFPYHFSREKAGAVLSLFPSIFRHSIGEFSGQPFHLEPWQAFGVGCIFGWLRDEDNSRRFRRAYWSMARKNGKSTLAAGISTVLAGFDVNPKTGQFESVAEVVLAATKIEQTRVISNELGRMRAQSEFLRSKSEFLNRTLSFAENYGSIRGVSSEKPFDGLNPHAVILDELHAWADHHRKFYDTMVTGGAARIQPFHLDITTAGDTSSRLWLEIYRYCKKVVFGDVEDPARFVYCFEIDETDDPLDESVWPKANPNLGISVKQKYLQEAAVPAQGGDQIELARFDRYHTNRLVDSVQRAFDPKRWKALEARPSNWKDADAVGAGVDLGSRDDLAAWGMCARFDTGKKDENNKPIYRFEVKAQGYLADECERDTRQPPFVHWIHTDDIKQRHHPITELEIDLLAEINRYGCHEIAYDPAGALQIAENFERAGLTVVRMPQSMTGFNEAIKTFKRVCREGRLSHTGNPVLTWCVCNAVTVADRQDRIMFDKQNSDEKIDLLVAVVMAFWRAYMAPSRDRGPMLLTV